MLRLFQRCQNVRGEHTLFSFLLQFDERKQIYQSNIDCKYFSRGMKFETSDSEFFSGSSLFTSLEFFNRFELFFVCFIHLSGVAQFY